MPSVEPEIQKNSSESNTGKTVRSRMKFRQRTSLRQKMVRRFAILLVLIPFFIVVTNSYMTFNLRLDSGAEQLTFINNQVTDKLSFFLSGLYRDVEDIADKNNFAFMLENKNQADFSNTLNNIVKKYDSFSMVFLVSPNRRIKQVSTLTLDQKIDDRYLSLKNKDMYKIGWEKNNKEIVSVYEACKTSNQASFTRLVVTAEIIPGKSSILFMAPVIRSDERLGCVAVLFPIHRLYSEVMYPMEKTFQKDFPSFTIAMFNQEGKPFWSSTGSDRSTLLQIEQFRSYASWSQHNKDLLSSLKGLSVQAKKSWFADNKTLFVAKQERNPVTQKTSFSVVDIEKGYRSFSGTSWAVLTTISYEDFFSKFFRGLYAVVIFFILLSAIGIYFIYRISGGILHLLSQAIDSVQKIGEGDLTQRIEIHRDDELGKLEFYLGRTILKLRLLIKMMSQSKDDSMQLAEVVRDRAAETLRSSQEQAALLEEASAAIEELSASTQSIYEASQKQLSGAETNKRAMQDLQKSFMRSVSIHDKISSQAEETTSLSNEGRKMLEMSLDNMEEVSESSTKILGIIDVINDIADQTDLLALNASIEAARAGGDGKGFAVVAQEISELAERSSSSSREIARLLRSTNQKVEIGKEKLKDTDHSFNRIASHMEKLTSDINVVADLGKEQSEVVDQTAGRAGKVTELAREIAEATRLQNQSAEEITEDMNRANEITITNVEKVETLDQILLQLTETLERGMRLAKKFRTRKSLKQNILAEDTNKETQEKDEKETSPVG